jgi:hypothetical protein
MMVEVFYLLLFLLYLSPVIIIIISFLEITNLKCFLIFFFFNKLFSYLFIYLFFFIFSD